MFQTTLPNYGSFHAAARCISGGPIYITDTPMEHNLDILNQMSALSPRGQSIILRPSCAALPHDPYIGYNDDRLLRVGNFTGSVRTGTSLMAVFNISKRTLSELVMWKDFRGSHADMHYLVRAHRTGKIVGGEYRDKNMPLALSLAQFAWEIFSAMPLERITTNYGKQIKICTFGIVTMMAGAAAVVRTSLRQEISGRIKYEVVLKAVGTVG